NFQKLIASVVLKHDFATMGKFQLKSLFLGMMHFQDEYTYDIKRVEKCDIHYSMPDGRVLPFCTFNVFPEVYRDKIQRQYAIPSKEWKNMHNDWSYGADKYVRNVKEIEATESYAKAYNQMINYFKLPINVAEADEFARKKGKPRAREVEQPAVMTVAHAHGHEHGHSHSSGEESSCACGKSGADSCACGGHKMPGGSCGCGGQ
ncbi:MAG: radical SAM protein, partial [Candidatus Micrarchaeota archaeon]|nr:radical SAM protein [Candidatus Micrarchaeota archaeon]